MSMAWIRPEATSMPHTFHKKIGLATSFGGSGMPSAAACDDEAPVASAGKAWPEEDAPAAGA